MTPGHNNMSTPLRRTRRPSAITANTIIVVVTLIAIGTSLAPSPVHSVHHTGQRWSRQVQNANGFINIAGSDWVPVPQFPTTRSVVPVPNDRQSGARVLNFAPPHLQPQNGFFAQHQQQQQQQPHQQQLLQFQPQSHQSHLNAIESRPAPPHLPSFASSADPFQLISAAGNNGAPHRFHVHQTPAVQFHQGGHQFGSPPAPISQQAQQFFQAQHSAAPQPQFHYAQQQQQQQHQQQLHQQQPQQHQQLPLPQHQALVLNPAELNQQYQFPQFVQQPQPSAETLQLQAQPLQHVLQQQYEVHPGAPAFMRHTETAAEQRKPHTEPLIQRAPQLYGQESEPKIRPNPAAEHETEEEVQLLYVPLDTLYKQQQQQKQQKQNQQQQQQLPFNPQPKAPAPAQNIKYNVQPVNPLQINNFYTATPSTIRTSATPATFPSSPAYVFEGSTQRYVQQQTVTATAATTPKPAAKVKPHQPPLAMFMLHGTASTDVSVNEVLHALKNARNIDVLDSASKKAPRVFVGPSGLRTPNGYSKFELPYLSSIEQNRGVNKLPFFVAPLSYKAPKGFAKIPLPAPHVGSVVVNSPPEVVQYQPIELPVQQQQQQQQSQRQPQRTQSYPKKVQSVAQPQSVQGLDQSGGYRTTSNPKYGFMLGRDVFTTSAKPYFAPTPMPSTTTTTTTTNAPRYQFVSSTAAATADVPSPADQYSRFPEFSANGRHPSSRAPSASDHSQRYQVSASDDEPFVPMTTPKPSFGRFGQRGTPATTRAPAPSTRIPFNYERFAQPSAQPTHPTYTPQQPDNDYTRFSASPSTRGPTKQPASSSLPALSTYSSQQHEDEYSRLSTPSATPSAIQSNEGVSLLSFQPNPSVSANVQSEEYFNVPKTPQMESFATPNHTNSYATNLYNQFHPSKDYFSVPPVTSSDATASAPKPTESENYSFVPLLTAKPATPRPEVTYTAKPAEHSTRAQEIYNMKNYFREQTAFKNRPQLQSSSLSAEEPDAVSRPAYSSFERNAPSSTPQYVYVRSTTTTTTSTTETPSTAPSTESNYIDRVTTPRNTITYYTPSSAYTDETPQPVHHFKFVNSVTGRPANDDDNNNDRPEQQSHREVFRTNAVSTESTLRGASDEKRIYSNHRDSYSDPSPTPKTRLFEYERSTAASPSTSHSYDYTSTSDEYNNLIRESIKQNQAAESSYEDSTAGNGQAYNLPSELPPISASLPSMVNSLFVETADSERDPEAATTVEPTTVSTRRTPYRGRRPQTQTTGSGSSSSSRATVTRAPITRPPRTTTTTTTASPDYTNSGGGDYVASTRKTTVRGRRPIHYANRTTTLRTPTVRNPNRVRYNPTSEERQRVRSKQKAAGGKNEDLEYQRDVLKQNYPAIVSRASSTPATPASAGDSTERSTRYTTAVSMVHETERYSSHYRAGGPAADDSVDNSEYYQHSPSPSPTAAGIASSTVRSSVYDDLPQHFSGLADHMQIPQEHQSLIGEYYNSESEVSAVEAINGNGRRTIENHPVFLTTPLTTPASLAATLSTTEEVAAIAENAIEPQRARRPNFVRRPVTGGSRPVYGTTTEAPERHTIRPKVRNDPNNAPSVYTPKSRNSRVRVRTTTTTTTAEPQTASSSSSSEQESDGDQNYQQISRFNKDFYQEAPRHRNFQRPSAKSVRNNEQKRFKFETFALDTQESQWSTKYSDNSFRPVDTDSSKQPKSLKTDFNPGSEPDIVTAGPVDSAQANGETYLVKVSSSLSGNGATVDATTTTTTTASTPSDKTFVDLLGEAMSELGNEIIGKTDSAELLEDHTESVFTTAASQAVADSAPDASDVAATSTSSSGAGNKRRGVWKRVRVRPADGFETAESQNYGSRIYNSIAAGNAKEQLSKADSEKGAFHSFHLDDDSVVDESEQPHIDQSEASDAINVQVTSESTMISTASSPGDVDLGTGAPVLTTMRAVTVNESRPTGAAVASTVETRFETTPQPVRSEEIETEIVPTQEHEQDHNQTDAGATFTTITSTRRYDIGDDLMVEDDHTEFPFAYEPFGHDADTMDDEQFNTEFAPESTATAEPAFYDDYEAEYHTSSSVSAVHATPAKPVELSAAPAEAGHSLMSDVKQKLSELFSFGSDDYDYGETNAVRPVDKTSIVKHQGYTTIERVKPTPEILAASAASDDIAVPSVVASDGVNTAPSSTESSASASTSTTTKSFHRNLMDSVIYATSTSTEVSHETEICYRGRCIKTEKKLH